MVGTPGAKQVILKAPPFNVVIFKWNGIAATTAKGGTLRRGDWLVRAYRAMGTANNISKMVFNKHPDAKKNL